MWELNPGHIGGKRVLSPLHHPCTSFFRKILKKSKWVSTAALYPYSTVSNTTKPVQMHYCTRCVLIFNQWVHPWPENWRGKSLQRRRSLCISNLLLHRRHWAFKEIGIMLIFFWASLLLHESPTFYQYNCAWILDWKEIWKKPRLRRQKFYYLVLRNVKRSSEGLSILFNYWYLCWKYFSDLMFELSFIFVSLPAMTSSAFDPGCLFLVASILV